MICVRLVTPGKVCLYQPLNFPVEEELSCVHHASQTRVTFPFLTSSNLFLQGGFGLLLRVIFSSDSTSPSWQPNTGRQMTVTGGVLAAR